MIDVSLVHASCVSFEDKGVLILGDSGSGKSDLALRIIDAGGVLIADDYVEIRIVNGEVYGHVPDSIKGMLEIRGVGLVNLTSVASTKIDLVLELSNREDITRLPEKSFYELNGVEVLSFNFDAFSASAIAKLRMICKMLLNTH